MSSIRSKIVRWALTTGLAFSFCTLHMLGQNPQSTSSYKLCFPRTTTPPNISLGPTDPGWAAEWTGAFTYTMGTPSGTSPAVTLRGIRATDSTVTPQDYLYLSIDAGNLDSTRPTRGPSRQGPILGIWQEHNHRCIQHSKSRSRSGYPYFRITALAGK